MNATSITTCSLTQKIWYFQAPWGEWLVNILIIGFVLILYYQNFYVFYINNIYLLFFNTCYKVQNVVIDTDFSSQSLCTHPVPT